MVEYPIIYIKENNYTVEEVISLICVFSSFSVEFRMLDESSISLSWSVVISISFNFTGSTVSAVIVLIEMYKKGRVSG